MRAIPRDDTHLGGALVVGPLVPLIVRIVRACHDVLTRALSSPARLVAAVVAVGRLPDVNGLTRLQLNHERFVVAVPAWWMGGDGWSRTVFSLLSSFLAARR